MNQRNQFIRLCAILIVACCCFSNRVCPAKQDSTPVELPAFDATQAEQKQKTASVPERSSKGSSPNTEEGSDRQNVIVEASIWSIRHSSKDLLTELEKVVIDPKSKTAHSKIITELKKRNRAAEATIPSISANLDPPELEKEFVANLSSLERELLASLVSKISSSQKLTSPSVVTRNGKSASIFVGQAVPISAGAGAADQVANFVDLGVKLEVLPRVKAEESIEIGFQFELKTKLDDETANALLNARKDLQKLYTPIISKDGKIKGEKLVFERPTQTPFLFELARINGKGSVPRSNTLAIIASGATAQGKPKESYMVFLTPRSIDRLQEGKTSQANQAKSKAERVQPAPPAMPKAQPVQADLRLPPQYAEVPYYQMMSQQHPEKMAEIVDGKSTFIPVPKNANPIQVIFDLPEGFKVDAGDLSIDKNTLKIDRNFELLQLRIEGKLDGKDVGVDLCLWDQMLSSFQAKVKFRLVLTADQIRAIRKEKQLARFVWAPNVSDLSQVSKDKKVFFQSFDVMNESDIRKHAEQEGYVTAAVIALFKDSNATIDDDYKLAQTFPVGLVWRLMDYADLGQLQTRMIRVKKLRDTKLDKVQLFDLYGATSQTSHLHLIRSSCAVVLEDGGGAYFDEATILLSPKDALAFDQAKQHGRVELLPRKKRDPNVSAAGYVQPGTTDEIEPGKRARNGEPNGEGPDSHARVRTAKVLDEVKSMRGDVANLKSNVQRIIELLENLNDND